jgi:hypothetical protein
MSANNFILSKDLLNNLFVYKDGKLYWKNNKGKRTKENEEAGRKNNNGYRQIVIKSRFYSTHRLIFLMHYGYLPDYIDHINGIKDDNRIENLRQATKSQNNQNTKLQKNNTSGCKGVSWQSRAKKWVAYTKVNNKRIHLGSFVDKELAELVAVEARNKYHGIFANHGK